MKIEDARAAYLRNPAQLLIESTPELKTITDFIAKHTSRGVIGLSGGVDSALVAALAVKALGKENVFGLMMPAGNSAIDLEYATRYAEQLGIKYEIIDLQPIVKVCEINTHDLFYSKIDAGNLKARLRMIHLYAAARKINGVVLGTGNKSEDMIGYFTKYGDGGVDILPIAQLYKTQVWSLAKEAGVPDYIVKRVPTAGLWQGQTDEGEIGIKYADLDRILLGVELGFNADRIAKVNHFSIDKVENIFSKIASARHKLEPLPMPGPKFHESSAGKRKPTLTVDAIITHDGKYVFVRRGYEPFKGMLAFPGGHVEYNEDCETAVMREVKEETGLDFKILGQLGTYSDARRDPRGHYATVVFFGEADGKPIAGDDAKEVVLMKMNDVFKADLAFDHRKILVDYAGREKDAT